MNSLVKILFTQDGEEGDGYWHLGWNYCGDPSVLCTGEYFTYGCADMPDHINGGRNEEGKTYILKNVKKGGITCPMCLEHIRGIKSVRL